MTVARGVHRQSRWISFELASYALVIAPARTALSERREESLQTVR
jgi:hypothetical protein